MPPRPYAELSSQFSSLESAVEACDNSDAAFCLQKARMAFKVVHASKPARQADMMADILWNPLKGEGGGVQQSSAPAGGSVL